jgi:hypothetical protein
LVVGVVDTAEGLVATGIAPGPFCVVSTVLAQAAARGEISADSDWSLLSDVTSHMGLRRVIDG